MRGANGGSEVVPSIVNLQYVISRHFRQPHLRPNKTFLVRAPFFHALIPPTGGLSTFASPLCQTTGANTRFVSTLASIKLLADYLGVVIAPGNYPS